jgi:hypothetical protein
MRDGRPLIGVHDREKEANRPSGLGGDPGEDGKVSALAPPFFHIDGVMITGPTVYSGDKPHRRPLRPKTPKNKYYKWPEKTIINHRGGDGTETAENFQWDNEQYSLGFTRSHVDHVLPEKRLPRGQSGRNRRRPPPAARSAAELALRPCVEVSGGMKRFRTQDARAKHNRLKVAHAHAQRLTETRREHARVKEETVRLLRAEVERIKAGTARR